MRDLKFINFDCRETFRKWLEKNHDKSVGIWMIFYKKHTNVECINYGEALEEALCYGWIDSTVKRINEDQYVRMFTPRTNISNWSDVNKLKVLSLIEKGKMTEAGLNKIDVYLKTGKVAWEIKKLIKNREKKEIQIPAYIFKALADNEPALTNFENLAQSYKKQYILWITSAKREETILNRLKESLELLKENRKLGMK